MSALTVVVNGRTMHVEAGTTVAQLVAGLVRTPDGVAVAVNDEVVSRSHWPAAEVRQGDRIELLGAAQGG